MRSVGGASYMNTTRGGRARQSVGLGCATTTTGFDTYRIVSSGPF